MAQKMMGRTANVISASLQFMLHHDHDDAQQHEDVFEDRDHAGGEHFVRAHPRRVVTRVTRRPTGLRS